MRKIEPIYDFIEVDATSKFELREKESAGWEIYGASRDLRSDHKSYVKMRRAVEKETKK